MAQEASSVRFPGDPAQLMPRYAEGLRRFGAAHANIRPEVIFVGQSEQTGCSSKGAGQGATAPAGGASARPDLGPPRVGDAAPDFELPDRNGHAVSLASLRGSDVVIHFTAVWCPYCDAEIDAIGRMAESYASSGVKVMLVDVQDKDSGWDSLQAHVAKSVILVRDASGDVSRRYAPPKAQPSFENRAEVMLAATVVVDKTGKIGAFELISTNPRGGFDPNLSPIRQNLDGRLANSGTPHVLDVTADKGEATAGSAGELRVHVHIGPDFHVMSNAPSKPNYVATVVEPSGPPGVTFDKPRYPAAVTYRLSDTEISTFLGDLDIAVPFTVAASVAVGAQEIHGILHYQACTEDPERGNSRVARGRLERMSGRARAALRGGVTSSPPLAVPRSRVCAASP